MRLLCARDKAVAQVLCVGGGVHCGGAPDGQGDGILGLERTWLYLDGVLDDGQRPRRSETALRSGAGGVTPGAQRRPSCSWRT